MWTAQSGIDASVYPRVCTGERLRERWVCPEHQWDVVEDAQSGEGKAKRGCPGERFSEDGPQPARIDIVIDR